jgi:hypothetical protein
MEYNPSGTAEMAKSVKALINPTMLTWAREQAGYRLADAAHKLGIDETRLEALEGDQETPTFAKLLDMALHDWLQPRSAMFQVPDETVQGQVDHIVNTYNGLVSAGKEKFQADPFVIAQAKVGGYTVITERPVQPDWRKSLAFVTS